MVRNGVVEEVVDFWRSHCCGNLAIGVALHYRLRSGCGVNEAGAWGFLLVMIALLSPIQERRLRNVEAGLWGSCKDTLLHPSACKVACAAFFSPSQLSL